MGSNPGAGKYFTCKISVKYVAHFLAFIVQPKKEMYSELNR